MKTLIVVFTPLQYLNARRLIENQQINKYDLIVLSTTSELIKQIENIAVADLKVPLRSFKYLVQPIGEVAKALYSKYFISHHKYSSIIIGNYNNIFAFFLARQFSVNGKEVILLDDGFATISVYYQRNCEMNLSFSSITKLNRFLISKLLGVNDSTIIPSLTYNTFFNISNTKVDKVKKIKNMHSVFDNKEKRVCIFIGQPLAELNIISFHQYEKILEMVNDYYVSKGVDFIYYYHRAERDKNFKFKCKRLDVPIELYFSVKIKVRPKYICSFYSTALYNFYQMFSESDIKYICITNYILDKNKRNKVENVYKYFKKHTNIEPLNGFDKFEN